MMSSYWQDQCTDVTRAPVEGRIIALLEGFQKDVGPPSVTRARELPADLLSDQVLVGEMHAKLEVQLRTRAEQQRRSSSSVCLSVRVVVLASTPSAMAHALPHSASRITFSMLTCHVWDSKIRQI